MITFAGFVVVTHHADAIGHEGQAILEGVSAAAQRLGHQPYHEVREHGLADLPACPDDQPRLHVGLYTIA